LQFPHLIIEIFKFKITHEHNPRIDLYLHICVIHARAYLGPARPNPKKGEGQNKKLREEG